MYMYIYMVTNQNSIAHLLQRYVLASSCWNNPLYIFHFFFNWIDAISIVNQTSFLLQILVSVSVCFYKLFILFLILTHRYLNHHQSAWKRHLYTLFCLVLLLLSNATISDDLVCPLKKATNMIQDIVRLNWHWYLLIIHPRKLV